MDFEDEENNRRTSSKMAFDAAEDSEYFTNEPRFTASRIEPCDAVSEAETLAYSFEDLTGNHSHIIYQSPLGSPSANRDALPSPVHSLYSNKPELLKTSPQPHLWVFPTQRNSSPISPQFPRDVIVSQRSAPSLIMATPRIKKISSMIQPNIANTSDQIIDNISNNTFTQNNLMETGLDPDKPFLIITEGDYNYYQRSIRLLDPNQPFTHAYPNRNIIMDFLRQNNFELVNDCELICVRGQKLRDLYFLLQKNTKQLSIGRLGYDGKEIQLWPLISQLKVLEEDF